MIRDLIVSISPQPASTGPPDTLEAGSFPCPLRKGRVGRGSVLPPEGPHRRLRGWARSTTSRLCYWVAKDRGREGHQAFDDQDVVPKLCATYGVLYSVQHTNFAAAVLHTSVVHKVLMSFSTLVLLNRGAEPQDEQTYSRAIKRLAKPMKPSHGKGSGKS